MTTGNHDGAHQGPPPRPVPKLDAVEILHAVAADHALKAARKMRYFLKEKAIPMKVMATPACIPIGLRIAAVLLWSAAATADIQTTGAIEGEAAIHCFSAA